MSSSLVCIGGIFTKGFRGFGSWAGLVLLKYGPAGSGFVVGSKGVGRVLVGREVGALFLGKLWMRPGFYSRGVIWARLVLGSFGLLEGKASR